jgi:hypothetical protein
VTGQNRVNGHTLIESVMEDAYSRLMAQVGQELDCMNRGRISTSKAPGVTGEILWKS